MARFVLSCRTSEGRSSANNGQPFVAAARNSGTLDGLVAAFFVMVVAAAEVVVGLAIIVTIFRTRRSASIDEASLMKY